jgi:hypothetical protein
MDELIARVAAALAIDEETARAAVAAVLKFLDANAPQESAPLLDKLAGAREAMAAQAEAGGGLMGALGGLFGGGGLMGLAGDLQGLGLGLGDLQALGREILDHGRDVAGEETMTAIAQATGLDQYI